MVGPETEIGPDEKIILAGNITLGNYRLSPHFTMWEFIRSSGHPQLVEVPHPLETLYMEQFARTVLDPLRQFVGPIHILSGHRGSDLNRTVGGVANSVHQILVGGQIIGVAADISPTNVSSAELFGLLPDLSGLPFTTAIYYPERKFVHIDNRNRDSKCFMVSRKKSAYVVLTSEEVRKYAAKER